MRARVPSICPDVDTEHPFSHSIRYSCVAELAHMLRLYAVFSRTRLLVQGFKVVIRDIALHMSNRAMDYHDEDWGLCQGALQAREQRGCSSEPDVSSVQEYLEMSHFVQASS